MREKTEAAFTIVAANKVLAFEENGSKILSCDMFTMRDPIIRGQEESSTNNHFREPARDPA